MQTVGVAPMEVCNRERRVEKLWSIVLIELTGHCNFSCSFCPIDNMARKKVTMKRDLWEKVIREVGEKKMADTIFFHVIGEPLVHRELCDAISLANGYGLGVSLYTNGALLDQKTTDRLLAVHRKGRVVLSLQDIRPVGFEQRGHGHLSWEEYTRRLFDFVRAVEQREEAVPVQVHSMIDIRSMGWNLRKIFREQRNIQAVYDQLCQALGKRSGARMNVLDPGASYPLGVRSSFYVKHMGTWGNQHIGDDLAVELNNAGHCALMNDTFAVLSDGTCTFCCGDYEGRLALGNANDTSIEDIFYGSKSTEVRAAEARGRFSERVCQECQGTLVHKDSGKPALPKILPSDVFILREHAKRYGSWSALRKVVKRLR